MKEEKLLFRKLSRDVFIAAAFVAFIFCILLFTVISGFFPKDEETERDAQIAVLEGNGALSAGGSDAQKESGQGNGAEEQESQEEQAAEQEKSGEKKAVKKVRAKPWFEVLQDNIDGFTDGLFLKKEMVNFNAGLTRWLTGDTYMESTKVLLGKEKWLFYRLEEVLKDYKGTNHFTEDELQDIEENLTDVRDYLEKKKGIRFIAMGIPDKENIYPEYMPDTMPKIRQESRGDKLAEFLQGSTDLTYIYPKEELLKAKEKYEIYYKTDTHWNQLGAFVGLQVFFSQIYGIQVPLENLQFEVYGGFAGDLATIGRLKDDYSIDKVYTFMVDEVDPAQYRNEVLLLIGDSFSGFLQNIAKSYYKKVYMISVSEFTMSMIDRYKPDIVVWENVERNMGYFGKFKLLKQ